MWNFLVYCMVDFFKISVSMQPLWLNLTFRGMPAAESRAEIKYFKYIFYWKIKHVRIFIIKYFIFGDSQPKHPAPIIHKDGEKNKMRLKTTKITFVNFSIMDVFLLRRGNRPRNPRVCLVQFGHHRSLERKWTEGRASQPNTREKVFN